MYVFVIERDCQILKSQNSIITGNCQNLATVRRIDCKEGRYFQNDFLPQFHLIHNSKRKHSKHPTYTKRDD
jgi:hypothetical protein